MPAAAPPPTTAPAPLIARIAAGDHAAEDELVETFSAGLTLMLRRLVRDPALAEDLHQETFRIVLEKARSGKIRDPERLAGFLRGTAHNLLLQEGRAGGRLRPLEDGRPERQEDAPQLLRLLRREETQLVRRLLGEMRFERDQQILVQFYLTEKSKQEICADLGVDPEAFKKTLFHARRRLRELWDRSEKAQRLEEDLRKTAVVLLCLSMRWPLLSRWSQ